MKKVTIVDVAKHANVSNSTVSQYLNKRYEYMGEKTRLKIEQAIEELQYRPNMLARSLTQKSTFTVGVIVANIVHDFSINVLNELEKLFDAQGFHMIVCNAADDPAKEKKHIEALLEKQVDGLIVFPTGKNKTLFKSLLKNSVPVIFLDRYIPTLPIPSVLLDNELAMEQAVSTMSAEPLALITTSISDKITPRIERVSGFKKALEKRNIPVDERYIQSVTPNKIVSTLKKMMQLETPPKGLIAANDRVLRGVMAFLKEEPYSIPDELQLASIDDVPYSSFINPSLTVIAQPAIDIAQCAVELLLKQIRTYEAPEELKLYRFKPVLILRQSTK